MDLDQLLVATRTVEDPTPDALAPARAQALGVLQADLARRARIIRARRYQRGFGAAGVLAAAAVVAVAIVQRPHNAAPPLTKQPPSQSPIVETRFTTVAQVIRAASAAPGPQPLGTAPYWKVVSQAYGLTCSPTCVRVPSRPRTMWLSILTPMSVIIDQDTFGTPDPTGIGTNRVDVLGEQLTWRQINGQHLTDAQVAAIIGDPYTKDGHPRPQIIMKNFGDIMAASPASRQIRQRMWAYLLSVPGVHLDGRATDATGRHGWKISKTGPDGFTQSYIIDTTSGTVLEGQYTNVKGSRGGTTYLSEGPSATAPTPSDAGIYDNTPW